MVRRRRRGGERVEQGGERKEEQKLYVFLKMKQEQTTCVHMCMCVYASGFAFFQRGSV